jgi:hypothetical protein
MTFFGLEAPFVGWRWIEETPAMMRGHAYAASNFPISGGIFYELTMGDYIPTGPNAPLRLSSITEETSVTISWVAPLYDGGSPILSYRVYQSSRSTGEYVLIATPSVTQHVQSGLVSGQTYWFKISAVNSLGEGASSVPLSTTPGTASAPRNITASWRSDGILITWEAPASMGGGNITTFKVYRSMGTGSELMATLGPSSFSFLDCNATATNAHSYHVVATNALGDGASSATVSVAPQNPGGTDQSILPISVAVAIIAALVLVVWLRRRR